MKPISEVPSTPLKFLSDDEQGHLILEEGTVLETPINVSFRILRKISSSPYSQIFEVCFENNQEKHYAMKVSSATSIRQTDNEATILQDLNYQHGSQSSPYIPVFYSKFFLLGHIFIIEELLSYNLIYVLRHHNYTGISLRLVQVVGKCVCEALAFMNQFFIIHGDIKPDNIVLKENSLDVKLIDYGSASIVGNFFNLYVQTRYYRAPEVILRVDLSSKSDVWSLGCTLLETFFGLPIFPGKNEFHMLQLITETLGEFPKTLLERSKIKDQYYIDNHLKTNEQYEHDTGIKLPSFTPYFAFKTIPELVMNHKTPPALNETQIQQREVFLDLIMNMLKIDPDQRYSIHDVQKHPFFNLDL